MDDPYKVKMIEENIMKTKQDPYHTPVLNGGSKSICLDVPALELLKAYYEGFISEQDVRRITLGL